LPDMGTLPYKAAMNASVDTRAGVVTVRCPYCLIGPKLDGKNGLVNPVDVTKFVEHEGKREHKVTCSKGHTLRFRTIAEHRERHNI
jgi:hypothetical protein